uniref:Med12 domain-containing protein n=1 Tax=Trichuris muris TaxID=70415 RepID=A0A5S6QG82_TRIMR
MASCLIACEKKFLKRPKLGPPDCYPQDAKQGEDELTAEKVRQGYLFKTPLSCEYESARSAKFDESLDDIMGKVLQSHNAIATRKAELNALQDAGRKKAGFKEPSIWHLAAKPKAQDAWFKDLSGNKPLVILGKRFPFLNKREEILTTLAEVNVSIGRAVWFLKMTNAQIAQQQECGKMKKKQVNDPYADWAQLVLKYLRDLITKLSDHYALTTDCSINVEVENAYRHWQYATKLSRYMFEEGLFDKEVFLNGILDIFSEKACDGEIGLLKLIVPLVLQLIDGFLSSVILSRRLGYLACKVLASLYCSGVEGSGSDIRKNWNSEHLNCQFHRTVLLGLSAVVHAILIDCSTAFVWNEMKTDDVGFNSKAYLCGSPLDILPCNPSELPMVADSSSELVRKRLESLQSHVRERSGVVESHWSFSKSERTGLSTIIQHLLTILDCLDTFKFEYVDETNHIGALYAKVFSSEAKDMEDQDPIVVRFLCHWAVTDHRYGSHRALVVTLLLSKRQAAYRKASSIPQYPFQAALFQYLENEAPNLGEMCSSFNIRQFTNLILLFSHLIQSNIFSHDQYVSMLVSSGVLKSGSCSLNSSVAPGVATPCANAIPPMPVIDDFKQFDSMDFNVLRESDDARLDLDKIVAMQEKHSAQVESEPSVRKTGTKLSKHYFNVLHFPLPQDEQYRHDCNQRQLLIFGLTADRDCRRHVLKKITKELNKLWCKKASVEFSQVAPPRIKKVFDSESLCLLSRKMQNLVFFDQHAVTDSCCDTCIEHLSDFACGYTNYLPTVENLDFFLSLLEESCNFFSMIEFIEAIVAILPRLEAQILERRLDGADSITLHYALCIVGYLRKHHCYLIQLESVICNIWRCLFLYIKSKTVLSSFSAERCIWIYIHDLYECCTFIRASHSDLYLNSRERIQRYLCFEAKPSCCSDVRGLLTDFQHDNMLNALFESPNLIIEPNLIQRLLENANFRYVFAVSAFKAVCKVSFESERLFQIVHFCTDVTALCPNLNADWIAILRVLCFPTCMGQDKCYYESLLEVDVSNTAIYPSLAVLVTSLLRRLCFRLEDFTLHVAFPALLPFWKHPESPKVEDAFEASAKLTLYILGKIFYFDFFGTFINQRKALSARTKGELYLMYSSADGMVPESILTLLISVLMLDDSNGNDVKTPSALKDILDTSKALQSDSCTADEQLSVMARDLLEQICKQEWIKRKFLHSTGLFDTKRLLNPLVNHSQAQRLLRMIMRSESEKTLMHQFELCSTKRELVSRILENLTIMNLWVSQTDLQLLLKQVQNLQNESLHVIDTIAKAVMEVFQPQTSSEGKEENSLMFDTSFDEIPPFWLMASLVARLPTFVQGRVLKAAASILENYQARRERNLLAQSSSLLGQQPFLSLLSTCLKGQDDQREGLLCSLLKQVQEFVLRVKEDPYVLCDSAVAHEMYGALQLRLGLVGSMFDMVCKSSHLENWALLSMQLILYGIVTEKGNRKLFFSCVDFLCILLLSCLMPDSASFSFSGQERSNDDCRRIYNNVIKKLKKELGDRYFSSMKYVYQLLPIPRHTLDVIVCDAYGSQPQKSSKSGSSSSLVTFSSNDVVQRKGLQIVSKEKLNPWEVIEGYSRENNGLRWSWFQGVKLDIQPETLLQQMLRMLPHEHHNALNRPPMPGELRSNPFLEALQVHYNPSSSDTAGMDKLPNAKASVSGIVGLSQEFTGQLQTPRTTKGRAKKASTRGRKNSRAAAAAAAAINSPMVVGRPMNVSQMQVNAVGPYGYYPQQMPVGNSPAMSGFGGGQPMGSYQTRNFANAPMQSMPSSSGKQAISAMIRGRQPSGSSGQQIVMAGAPPNHVGGPVSSNLGYVAQPMNSMGSDANYNPSLQHMQMQMDSQRQQQMMQESMMDQQVRPALQRTMVVQQQAPQHAMTPQMAQPGPYPGYSSFPNGMTTRMPMNGPQQRDNYAQMQNFSATTNYGNQYYQQQNGNGPVRMVQPDLIGSGSVRYGQPNVLPPNYQMQNQQMRPAAPYQQPAPAYPSGQQQYQSPNQALPVYQGQRLSQYGNAPGQEFNQNQQINYYPAQY